MHNIHKYMDTCMPIYTCVSVTHTHTKKGWAITNGSRSCRLFGGVPVSIIAAW